MFAHTEKTKENDLVESLGDGFVTLSSVNTASVESENHEVTNAEQLRRKSPDEVCANEQDVLWRIIK